MSWVTYCDAIGPITIAVWAQKLILLRAFLWTQFTMWTPRLANGATACCPGNRFTDFLATASTSSLLLYFHVAP